VPDITYGTRGFRAEARGSSCKQGDHTFHLINGAKKRNAGEERGARERGRARSMAADKGFLETDRHFAGEEGMQPGSHKH
jgi:hypothetical protein